MPPERFGLVVIGSGLAGLSAAYAAAKSKGGKNKSIALVCCPKGSESASTKAQGGIACAMGKGDSAELHVRDTLTAGDGLCNARAVNLMVKESVPRIRELIELGISFDDGNEKPDLGIEGGHSARRVLHINGDATGKGMSEFMRKLALEQNVHLLDGEISGFAISAGGAEYAGCVLSDGAILQSSSAIIAAGGFAPLYSNSTNPQGSAGACIYAAHLAGTGPADMEFVQFHPTVLIGRGENYLITESVRGEGARLVDEEGRQFMPEYSTKGELDTRDVVSRAIFTEIEKGHKIFLDVGGLAKAGMHERFPSLHEKMKKEKIGLGDGLLPIRPAAHYTIGGIRADTEGRTNVRGIYAAGECASTGVHGANRLACNSLLEALVFGQRAGEDAVKDKGKAHAGKGGTKQRTVSAASPAGRRAIGKILWEHAGIVRSAQGLKKGIAELGKLENCAERQIALLVLNSALSRRESRGVHFREDFPRKRAEFARA
ncbi:MAG: FAD-binding protein [Candidatus Diapherotrites archaeon]